MDLGKFRTDRAREDEGVWTDIGDGARLKLARIGNRRYRELVQRVFRPHRRALRSGTLPEETSEALMSDVIAETVLLGWDGLLLDGRPVPYAPERARAVLADPAMRDFRDMVVELAGDMEMYRQQDLEDAEKKLRDFVVWHLDWGGRIGFLERVAAETGTRPAALAARPDLFADLEPVAEAFRLLAAGRPTVAGFAEALPQPIPLTEIRAYLDLVGDDDPEAFVHLLRGMGEAYLARLAERRRERGPDGT